MILLSGMLGDSKARVVCTWVFQRPGLVFLRPVLAVDRSCIPQAWCFIGHACWYIGVSSARLGVS